VINFKLLDQRDQLSIEKKPFHQWVFPDGVLWTAFYRTDTGYLLRFPGMADFEVSSDGSLVICRPAPDVPEETAKHLYLNQVLPLALSKLGKLVFHAGTVEIAGMAFAFVGEAGRGKSTLTASFARNGFRFLTDDGLVLEVADGGYQAVPSHPSIRLWADSEKALIPPGAEMAPAVNYTSKSRFMAGAGIAFCNQALPLRRVYFLGDGSAQAIDFKPLGGADALVELVKHSFLLDIEDHHLLADQFDHLARLANQPIHFRLDYPRRYEDLAMVRQSIVEHVNGHF